MLGRDCNYSQSPREKSGVDYVGYGEIAAMNLNHLRPIVHSGMVASSSFVRLCYVCRPKQGTAELTLEVSSHKLGIPP
jgi:hypothetical protein